MEVRLTPQMENSYVVEAFRAGKLLWTEQIENLVVKAGLDDLLLKYFKGSIYTAAHYVGLTGTVPTFTADDTLASHSGWTEVTAYSEGVRQTLTIGSIVNQSGSNALSKAQFTINVDNTVIGGAFVATNSTKGGSSGTLYGGGAFSVDRTLMNGDVLSVTITVTAAAA